MIKRVFIKGLVKISFSSTLAALHELTRGYLANEGWFLSFKKKRPLDREGKELPWFTYPFIRFLEERLNKNLTVFEYGSGGSTIWFSKRTKAVVSTEHDETWFEQMKDKVTEQPNVKYLLRSTDTDLYQKEILNYEGSFDIIVIDGRQRNECCKNAVGALKEKGLIIWDNSDRPEYSEGYEFLSLQGFKRIDFWGMGPINNYAWCTSVFYKDDNCFNI